MKKVRLADLVLDFALYPRAEVDAYHVATISNAIEAGAELPPIIADKATKRVVDGFHRTRAYRQLFGDEAEADVVFKTYADEAAMFLDAIRYNAGHGRSLTSFDRAHSVIRAEAMGITVDQIAAAMSLTVDAIGRLTADRVGTLKVARGVAAQPIPLKRTIRHMAGQSLTQAQVDANGKLSGMEQLFYVNQIITLVESDLLDTSNEPLMAALARLRKLLAPVLKQAA